MTETTLKSDRRSMLLFGCEVNLQINGQEVRALLDTGASNTCIDDELAHALELPIVGKRTIGGALSHSEVNVYEATVRIMGLDVERKMQMPGIHQPGRDKALLGRDLLQFLHMEWDGKAGTVVLTHGE